jgi:predicted ABC-type ATPase
MHPVFDARPIVVAIAGPNGAGKTTFYNALVQPSGLRFLNADEIAANLDLDAYEAAKIATALRTELIKQRESFVFETVFSDPVGDKITFLKETASLGYSVVLCYIGISNAEISEERVAMRVSQGGHDVPTAKLTARFPRILSNLRIAIGALPSVLVYDNGDLAKPYRQIAVFEKGAQRFLADPVPAWFRPLLQDRP